MKPARPQHRDLTRNERYNFKARQAVRLPIIPVCINFMFEENTGFVVRAAACFGAEAVGVIGQVPERPELKSRSGGLSDRTKLYRFANPSEFLAHVRAAGDYIVAAELDERAESAFEYRFPLDRTAWLVLCNEHTGVPEEVLLAADAVVKIPMLGSGFSLNCSQTANCLLFEYARQWSANVAKSEAVLGVVLDG